MKIKELFEDKNSVLDKLAQELDMSNVRMGNSFSNKAIDQYSGEIKSYSETVAMLKKLGFNSAGSDSYGSEWDRDSDSAMVMLSKSLSITLLKGPVVVPFKNALEAFHSGGNNGYNARFESVVNDEELKALKLYKTSGYKSINSKLRNDKEIGDVEKLIDSAMRKSSVGFDGFIFRSLKLNHVPKVGETLSDKAFTSWTSSSKIAMKFHHSGEGDGDIILAYQISENENGLRLDKEITLLEGEEYEVLLPRNKTFKVHFVVNLDSDTLFVEVK